MWHPATSKPCGPTWPGCGRPRRRPAAATESAGGGGREVRLAAARLLRCALLGLLLLPALLRAAAALAMLERGHGAPVVCVGSRRLSGAARHAIRDDAKAQTRPMPKTPTPDSM